MDLIYIRLLSSFYLFYTVMSTIYITDIVSSCLIVTFLGSFVWRYYYELHRFIATYWRTIKNLDNDMTLESRIIGILTIFIYLLSFFVLSSTLNFLSTYLT